MEDYRARITEVYEGPGGRPMSGVQYPNAPMAYEKKVVYEVDDGYRPRHHHHRNPERVLMTEVEEIVEKPRLGYGEVIYEEVEAARYVQPRPTGYGTRNHLY